MIKTFILPPYKCFQNGINIESPCLVNLIIGKNNSGKSSFLDYMTMLYTGRSNKLKQNKFVALVQIDKEMLNYIYTDIVDRRYYYNDDFKKSTLINKELKITGINRDGKVSFECKSDDNKSIVPQGYSIGLNNPDTVFYSHLKKCDAVFKLGAERDIKQEEKKNDAIVFSNGDGIVATMLYHKINHRGKRELISKILQDLNDVLTGECSFKDLSILENDDGRWEIRLTNSDGNEIALSDMGSGIKTIIFVSFVLNYRSIKNDNSLLLFEELENNLHPEVQRRLFNKVYNYAIQNNCPVFITSHSNVAINTLFGKENVMVYHVYKESENISNIKSVTTPVNKKEILDDLGVKANDIFQTNGIIWVEGPSDRIYLNKWIELIDPELKENVDYTFLYYGGRLLAHYSAGTDPKDFIDTLLTNRNSAILIDSDKKGEDQEINDTKKRIIDEFQKSNSFYWVTKGREIENYISKDALNRKYAESNLSQIDTFSDFKDYIKGLEPSFENKKVEFAKSLSFEKGDLKILDLEAKVDELVKMIKKWNGHQ